MEVWGNCEVGPAEDAADLLVVGEAAVGVVRRLVWSSASRAGEEDDGDGFGAGGDVAGDDGAGADAGLLA